MTEPFLVSEDRLLALKATRQGRISIAGYNYQAAYAVLRLSAMSVRMPVLRIEDWPVRLRYDWGEDLDESCAGGQVIFTQCKRISTVGQPASIADILTGFAPKWLWVSPSLRERLRFRLICPDSRFDLDRVFLDSLRSAVRDHFTAQLSSPPKTRSDIAVWTADANAAGPEALFDSLWSTFECIYLPMDVVDSEPAGSRLVAEQEALRVLLERGLLDSAHQAAVLGRLRRLVHDNLITFDPTSEMLASFDFSPRHLDRADVNAAIYPYRPTKHRRPPFHLVDKTFLSEQRELERRPFVARQPDWSDVIHGQDDTVKFIERDRTMALETAVRDKVISRIGRIASLPVLFVVGAPGGGKTTLARRVAARLVNAGEVLIADTGVGLRQPPGDPSEYTESLERLQDFDRPVILLLDDPLYAESQWFEVLVKLNRPGLRVGVLSATPKFLLDEHEGKLKAVENWRFEMGGPSPRERESLAALYGRAQLFKSEEDFLVVAMEAAAGIPFREIIERLWRTLADGRDLSGARVFSDLPWQVRAYIFACFFSKDYDACPEPLLLKGLEITGSAPGGNTVRTELARMKYYKGWGIFRINEHQQQGIPQAASITSAHAVIAQRAWKQRPLPWCQVTDVVVEAAVQVPQVIGDVAIFASRPKSTSSDDTDGDFARMLVERCQSDVKVETRTLCIVADTLIAQNCVRLLQTVREALTSRLLPNSQGWLALLSFWNLAASVEERPGLPVGVDPLALIQCADFSIDSSRAIRFANAIKKNEQLSAAYLGKLFQAFDGNLQWQLDALLLRRLFSIAPRDELFSRSQQTESWLDQHYDDAIFRGHYLVFLRGEIPEEFTALRAKFARDTTDWLDNHPDDSYVRERHLTFLKVNAELTEEIDETARKTAEWLDKHPEDCTVRACYLSFLKDELPHGLAELKASFVRKTADWLDEHPDESNLRSEYLRFVAELPSGFDELKDEVARKTADWLEEHRSDFQVRASYLSFLLKLSRQFDVMGAKTARQTADWLKEHLEDAHVRARYLRFVRQFPADFLGFRTEATRKTMDWLEQHPENISVRKALFSFIRRLPPELSWLRAEIAERLAVWFDIHRDNYEILRSFVDFLANIIFNQAGDRVGFSLEKWQRVSSATLTISAELIRRSGFQWKHRMLLVSCSGLHNELLRSLHLHESGDAGMALALSSEVAAEWFERNPTSSVQFELDLP
jgi:hypothetical protein